MPRHHQTSKAEKTDGEGAPSEGVEKICMTKGSKKTAYMQLPFNPTSLKSPGSLYFSQKTVRDLRDSGKTRLRDFSCHVCIVNPGTPNLAD